MNVKRNYSLNAIKITLKLQIVNLLPSPRLILSFPRLMNILKLENAFNNFRVHKKCDFIVVINDKNLQLFRICAEMRKWLRFICLSKESFITRAK